MTTWICSFQFYSDLEKSKSPANCHSTRRFWKTPPSRHVDSVDQQTSGHTWLHMCGRGSVPTKGLVCLAMRRQLTHTYRIGDHARDTSLSSFSHPLPLHQPLSPLWLESMEKHLSSSSRSGHSPAAKRISVHPTWKWSIHFHDSGSKLVW